MLYSSIDYVRNPDFARSSGSWCSAGCSSWRRASGLIPFEEKDIKK